MNDSFNQQSTEFVFRRVQEPVRVFGSALPPWVWWVVLGAVVAVGLFYIAWMYVRDSRTIGPWWATFLGLLRAGVYVAIGWVFLLPANQTWYETRQRSKVVLLFDVSGSITSARDDIPPPGKSLKDMPTRQDLVMKFLASEGKYKDVDFLKRLQDKNPIAAYRFARSLDPEFRHLTGGRFWPKPEYEKLQAAKARNESGPDGYPLAKEHWLSWLTPLSTDNLPQGWDRKDPRALEFLRQIKANRDQLDPKVRFFDGTAVGESLLELIKQERNQMVQGIVIFTDGRSTDGSLQAIRDAATSARDDGIPVFVVALGEDRAKVAIDIVDVRVPPLIRPEDKFPVVVSVNGQDMPNEPFELFLDVTRITRDKQGKIVEKPIELVQLDSKGQIIDKSNFVLASKITLSAARFAKEKPVFKPGNPPNAQVHFQLDAARLAEAVNKTVEGKVGIAPDDDSEIRFRARVTKDKREITEVEEHVSEPADMRVQKKPLRVLLFASAATREYQFMRTLLVREMDKGRAEVCIHIQTIPETERRTGIVQDVDPSRILSYFPTKRKAGKGDKDPYYSLSSYDVVVCFDVNWGDLSQQQLQMLNEWVDKDGGGLVVIAGGLNTEDLGKPLPKDPKVRTVERYPLLYIRNMLPVDLEDVREKDVTTDVAHRLIFPQATAEMEFMRLDDADPKADWKKGWDRFFNEIQDEDGKVTMVPADAPPERGFYYCFPSKSAKQNALVMAAYAVPGKSAAEQKPFLAQGPWGDGKVVWLASGEMWRLRSYRDTYHERFWTKLLRDVGSKSVNTMNKRITPVMSRYGAVNKFQTFEARFEDTNGDPLPRKLENPPKMIVTLPEGIQAHKGDQVVIKEGDATGKEAKVAEAFNSKTPDGDVRMLKLVNIGGDAKAKTLTLEAKKVEVIIPAAAFKPRIPVKDNESDTRKRELDKSNDGWFKIDFQPRAAGEYKIKVIYEDAADNVYNHKFIVKESNPETDNVRPDYEALWELAGNAKPVLDRITDEKVRARLRAVLKSPSVSRASPDGVKKEQPAGTSSESMRLLFDLDGAKEIPSAMVSARKDLKNRGRIQDLWDRGVVWDSWEDRSLLGMDIPFPLRWAETGETSLSVILVLIVGLLSIEWLTRKLLRLA